MVVVKVLMFSLPRFIFVVVGRGGRGRGVGAFIIVDVVGGVGCFVGVRWCWWVSERLGGYMCVCACPPHTHREGECVRVCACLFVWVWVWVWICGCVWNCEIT